MFARKWITPTEGGGFREIEPKPKDLGLDNIIAIEEFTDYEFSISDKIEAFENDTRIIVDEKIKSFNNFAKLALLGIGGITIWKLSTYYKS